MKGKEPRNKRHGVQTVCVAARNSKALEMSRTPVPVFEWNRQVGLRISPFFLRLPPPKDEEILYARAPRARAREDKTHRS